MEQDPLTAAKLPLSARPRSSSSPQKEASGPSFKKKKAKKKRTKQQKEKPKREKTEPSRYVHPYFYIISTLFFFFYIPPLSRSLSFSLSLSVALALSLSVSRTNCVGYYNFHALAPEFGSSETSTYLRRWRKVRLGLKKLFILFSLKEKNPSAFYIFPTHTRRHTPPCALLAVSLRGVL